MSLLESKEWEPESLVEIVSRRIQENMTNTTDSGDDEDTEFDDSQVLRDTFMVYGSILVVLFLLFCHVRQKHPRVYSVRSWVDSFPTHLAKDSYGFFSWILHVGGIPDDEFRTECGLDALCLVRITSLGYRIALVGIANALWLMPVYRTSPDTEGITDGVVRVSISNVPSESPRLIATSLACYVVFGYTMYAVMKEFEWFIEQRHKWLQQRDARQYALYVSQIPDDAQASPALRAAFSHVVEANVRLLVPELGKLVAQRDSVVAQLEHAIADREINGKPPTHKTKDKENSKFMRGSSMVVDSIETYTKELIDLNKDIAERIAALEGSSPPLKVTDTLPELIGNESNEEDPSSIGAEPTEKKSAMNSLLASATSVKGMFAQNPDGDPCSAGFVVFDSLQARQSALQTLQSNKPHVWQVSEAPDPDDVLWGNVGKSNRELQLGKLFSLAATSALCLFWTIPMSFIASLSSVGALREEFGFIDDALDAAPGLEPVLELIAPLFVVIVNSLLPIILEAFCHFEGPISEAQVMPSLFGKLSAFMIIQTFFVSALSGGIMQELSGLVDDPTSVIDLLANSLPTQSTYFVQILVVATAISGGVEILRVSALATHFIHGCVAPQLTKRERENAFMGIRPLADPDDFQHPDITSQLVLYFTVLLVYTVIAPITNFILAFCFVFLGAIYRHQFVYAYPPADSGGKIWISFIRIFMICVFIAQFTILGLLGLKQGAAAAALMIPLLIITFLFNSYIGQQHYRVAQFLPSRDALKQDLKNGPDMDFSFVKGAYVQPEMKDKQVLPEISEEEIRQLGLTSPEEPMEPLNDSTPIETPPEGEVVVDNPGSSLVSNLSRILGRGSKDEEDPPAEST